MMSTPGASSRSCSSRRQHPARVRWHALVRMAGGTPRWTASVEVFLTSVIINYAAPIGLAVPTRALTVRDLEMSPGQSGAVVGWEAALDVVALCVISAAWLVLGGSDLVQTMSFDSRILALLAVVVGIGAIATSAASRSTAIRSRIAPFAGRMRSSPGSTRCWHSLPLCSPLGSGASSLRSWPPVATLRRGGLAFAPPWDHGCPGAGRHAQPAAWRRRGQRGVDGGGGSAGGAAAAPIVLAAIAYRLALFLVTPLVWGAVRLVRAGADRH